MAVAFSFLVMSVVRLKYAWKHINEMKLSWYTIMTLLYILFIVVVLVDSPLYINIPLYLVILAVVCLMSRDVIVPVWDTVKKLIRKS